MHVSKGILQLHTEAMYTDIISEKSAWPPDFIIMLYPAVQIDDKQSSYDSLLI